MNFHRVFLTCLGLAGLAGCGNVDSSHLVFGQKISVGLTISASGPEQGGELALGYKDRNIAIIPVAMKLETPDKDGNPYVSLGSYDKAAAGELPKSDAYSTLGQFELNTGNNGTASVGLGKFFATGVAAQTLAEGFKEKLKK